MTGKLAPWIPTPIEVVYEALRASWANRCDVLYDLGCGDGRVLVVATRDFGVRRAVGIEIDSFLAEVARVQARLNNVSSRVVIVEDDFFKVDISDATLVYLYLYQSINEALKPKLESELRPGSRVVSIDFPIPGWTPVRVVRLRDSSGIVRTIRVYVIGVSDTRWSSRGRVIDDWYSVRAWMAEC